MPGEVERMSEKGAPHFSPDYPPMAEGGAEIFYAGRPSLILGL